MALLAVMSVLWALGVWGPCNGMMDGAEGEFAGSMDRHFIEQMIPHHQMGVMMARMVLSRTDRPEIEQLARSIITSQTAEIERMQEWYSAWY